MCSSSRKYKSLEKSIKKTWATNLPPTVKIIFYVDNQRSLFKKKQPVLEGWNLTLPCKDGYDKCTEKTLMAFKYVSDNFKFDYIFRTNLGSYVNPKKIIDFLDNKPLRKFYCGIIGFSHEYNIHFASGSGFFLSEDLVKFLNLNSDVINHQLIDDIAIFLANNNIVINRQARRLSYVDDVTEYQVGSETVPLIEDNAIYHVRLRSSDREIDIKRMISLFNSNF